MPYMDHLPDQLSNFLDMTSVLTLDGPSKNGKKKPESSTSNGKQACNILNQSTHDDKQYIEHSELIQTVEKTIAEDIPVDQDAAPPLKEDIIWTLMLLKLAEAYNTPKQRKTN